MSVQDMERCLVRHQRRPLEKIMLADAGGGGPHTARALLEENQRLSVKKREVEQMERKASKELIDQIFERDQQNLDNDRIREQKRREAHQALAQKYKSAIVQKELSQAQEYDEKRRGGPGEEFFPFVEGETVERYREEQNSVLRSEMRDWMKKQRDDQPPRRDALLASVSTHHHHHYPNDGPTAVPV